MKTEGYSIKDLETISDIKAHTIRIWEKRYGLLKPERTDTNIRYYTDDDLRHLLNISMLVKNGYKISKVSRWDNEQIKDSVLSVSKEKRDEEGYVDRLLLCMVNFDNIGFYELLDEIFKQFDLEEANYRVIFPLFERIGTFWQVGSIFPAQEHYVTNIMRQKLIAEIDRLTMNNTRGKTMLFFLHENELHELSLLYYSYLAKKKGFNVIYLGQFVPFDDLVKLKKVVDVDFVFSAFTNSIGKDELENYLSDLKNLFDHQKIFVTGWQVNHLNPVLPRNVKTVKDYKEFNKYIGS